jgi:hypothetical protein
VPPAPVQQTGCSNATTIQNVAVAGVAGGLSPNWHNCAFVYAGASSARALLHYSNMNTVKGSPMSFLDNLATLSFAGPSRLAGTCPHPARSIGFLRAIGRNAVCFISRPPPVQLRTGRPEVVGSQLADRRFPDMLRNPQIPSKWTIFRGARGERSASDGNKADRVRATRSQQDGARARLGHYVTRRLDLRLPYLSCSRPDRPWADARPISATGSGSEQHGLSCRSAAVPAQ